MVVFMCCFVKFEIFCIIKGENKNDIANENKYDEKDGYGILDAADGYVFLDAALHAWYICICVLCFF